MKDDYYPTAWDTQANWLWHALDPTPVPVPAANREVGTVRAELPVVGAWHRQANCRGTKVDMFREWRKALDVCANCSVRAECFDEAVRMEVQAGASVVYGVIGGMNADERISVVRRVRDQGATIYFAQISTGLIKIGTTTQSVHGRMQSLSYNYNETFDLLAVESGGYGREAELHQRFNAHRVRGEFFRPAPALLEYIASITAAEQVAA